MADYDDDAYFNESIHDYRPETEINYWTNKYNEQAEAQRIAELEAQEKQRMYDIAQRGDTKQATLSQDNRSAWERNQGRETRDQLIQEIEDFKSIYGEDEWKNFERNLNGDYSNLSLKLFQYGKQLTDRGTREMVKWTPAFPVMTTLDFLEKPTKEHAVEAGLSYVLTALPFVGNKLISKLPIVKKMASLNERANMEAFHPQIATSSSTDIGKISFMPTQEDINSFRKIWNYRAKQAATSGSKIPYLNRNITLNDILNNEDMAKSFLQIYINRHPNDISTLRNIIKERKLAPYVDDEQSLLYDIFKKQIENKNPRISETEFSNILKQDIKGYAFDSNGYPIYSDIASYDAAYPSDQVMRIPLNELKAAAVKVGIPKNIADRLVSPEDALKIFKQRIATYRSDARKYGYRGSHTDPIEYTFFFSQPSGKIDAISLIPKDEYNKILNNIKNKLRSENPYLSQKDLDILATNQLDADLKQLFTENGVPQLSKNAYSTGTSHNIYQVVTRWLGRKPTRDEMMDYMTKIHEWTHSIQRNKMNGAIAYKPFTKKTHDLIERALKDYPDNIKDYFHDGTEFYARLDEIKSILGFGPDDTNWLTREILENAPKIAKLYNRTNNWDAMEAIINELLKDPKSLKYILDQSKNVNNVPALIPPLVGGSIGIATMENDNDIDDDIY